jgi:hypothetical protein
MLRLEEEWTIEQLIVCTPLSINVFVILDYSNIWNTIVELFLKHLELKLGGIGMIS